jgi:hypothetical protein
MIPGTGLCLESQKFVGKHDEGFLVSPAGLGKIFLEKKKKKKSERDWQSANPVYRGNTLALHTKKFMTKLNITQPSPCIDTPD